MTKTVDEILKDFYDEPILCVGEPKKREEILQNRIKLVKPKLLDSILSDPAFEETKRNITDDDRQFLEGYTAGENNAKKRCKEAIRRLLK